MKEKYMIPNSIVIMVEVLQWVENRLTMYAPYRLKTNIRNETQKVSSVVFLQ